MGTSEVHDLPAEAGAADTAAADDVIDLTDRAPQPADAERAAVLAHFERLTRELAREGATPGIAYQHRAVKRLGEPFVCLEKEGIVVRLPATTPARAEALATEGAHLFRVGAGAVTLDDWILVPLRSADRWDSWVREAAAAVPA